MPANIGNRNPGVARATLQDKLRKLGPDNSHLVAPTALSAFAPSTGRPATTVQDDEPAADELFVNELPPAIEVELMPYGSGAAGQKIRGTIVGYKELDPEGAGATGVHVYPRILGTYEGVLGSRAGVAGMGVGTGELFCDSITILSDNTPGSGMKVMNVTSGISTLVFDARGCQWFGVQQYGGTGGAAGTGTGAGQTNALWTCL